jgi:hypothetical protein
VGINHRRSHIAVPQQFLNGANVVVRLQQMAGETVPLMPNAALTP